MQTPGALSAECLAVLQGVMETRTTISDGRFERTAASFSSRAICKEGASRTRARRTGEMVTRTWGWRTACGIDGGDGCRSNNLQWLCASKRVGRKGRLVPVSLSGAILCPLARRQGHGGEQAYLWLFCHAPVAMGAYGFSPSV